LLGDCCEIAWHQGLDLYGYDDNRLLKGFEYTARYNLGESVPFVETLDRTGKYHHFLISTNGRGRFRAVYEEVYNHYANRAGVPTPYLRRVVEKIRPEGPGLPGADHVGFGTLLFARNGTNAPSAAVVPGAPGGFIATGSEKAITLTWIASAGANGYSVQRAAGNGKYESIPEQVPSPTFTDTNVVRGEVYRYVVSARNAGGGAAESYPISIGAGLPNRWTQADIGALSQAGGASFDGAVFTLEGAGTMAAGTNDACQFAGLRMEGDGAVTARFVPQTSSQFSRFGLVMRESTAPGAASVCFLICPQAARDIEAPGWKARLFARTAPDTAATLQAASDQFAAPVVTFGRMTGPVWLRLQRTGDNFIGSTSTDGKSWTQVGPARVPLNRTLVAGLAVSSGIPKITTTVKFDNVSLSGGKMDQRTE
jgi:hypothetical protein